MDRDDDLNSTPKCFYDGVECTSRANIVLFEELQEIQKLQLHDLSEGSGICPSHLNKQIRMFLISNKSCCDPLKIHKTSIKINLRDVNIAIREEYSHGFKLIPGQKLCYKCLYTRLPQWLEENPPQTTNQNVVSELPESSESQHLDSQKSIQQGSQSSHGSAKEVLHDIIVEKTIEDMNLLYDTLEIDGGFRRRSISKRYLEEADEKITESVRKKLRVFEPSYDNVEEKEASYFQEIIKQVTDRLEECESNNEKCMVLSILPRSWSATEISNRTGVTWHLAARSKKLVDEKGILRKPSTKNGKKIDEKTVELVQQFYVSDEVSRVMPGLNDCKTFKVDGVKVTEQRRLLLNNLKELWARFKELYPKENIGLSSFAMLRPPHCVFAGAPGTHSVCVCSIHQNMKLLLSFLDLNRLDPENEWNYKFILSKMVCAQPSEDCYLGSCKSCPPIDNLITEIACLLDNDEITEVTYKQWISTDRANLVTLIRPVHEILEYLKEELPVLLRHDFIAKSQAASLRELKESLPAGHVIASGDFSENLSLLIQDAIQKWHWANEQVTIHPWVCYFKDLNGDVQHISIVMISDCLSHDVYTVATLQKHLITLLKAKIPGIKKVHYFTDGAASQYKNRFNFTNLAYHKVDYDIAAIWYFFATSHGKGPCDAIGGKLKRAVRRASLQRPLENQITSAKEVFEWAKTWDTKIICDFVPKEEIDQMKEELSERFSKAKTIKGTLKLHCFQPNSTQEMSVKTHSSSSYERIVKL